MRHINNRLSYSQFRAISPANWWVRVHPIGPESLANVRHALSVAKVPASPMLVSIPKTDKNGDSWMISDRSGGATSNLPSILNDPYLIPRPPRMFKTSWAPENAPHCLHSLYSRVVDQTSRTIGHNLCKKAIVILAVRLVLYYLSTWIKQSKRNPLPKNAHSWHKVVTPFWRRARDRLQSRPGKCRN